MNDLHDAIRAETGMMSPAPRPGIANIAKALAKAQGEFTPVPKSRTVKVRTQNGAYDFAYAPLDEILAMALPILSRHDLALSHVMVPQERGPLLVVTKLMHGGSGEVLESVFPLVVQGSGPQAMGSAITYAKRYSVTALLGISSEEDDDGNAAQGNAIESRQDRPRQSQAQQRPASRPAPERGRDGTQAAWSSMAWPVANKSAGWEDMRDGNAWRDTLLRWLDNILRSESLPADMKPQMIANLRDKHAAIFDHLEERGEEDIVADVRAAFRKALRED